MQVFIQKENKGNLTKTSATTVQLAPSTITIGAKQYTSANLVCDTGVTGVGGIDNGTLNNSALYYIYAVVDLGVSKLVASESASAPAGFSVYQKAGAFKTDGSGDVSSAFTFGSAAGANNTLGAIIDVAGNITSQSANFIQSVANISTTWEITWVPGFFTVPPAVTASGLNASRSTCHYNGFPPTTVSCRISTHVSSTHTRYLTETYITVTKQGVDYEEASALDWT